MSPSNLCVSIYNICVSIDFLVESIQDSSSEEDDSPGREQHSGRKQCQRVPGTVRLHLLLWRLRKVDKKAERVGKYMYKSNSFISYFNDILVRGIESIGIRCAVFVITFAFLFKNSFP